MTIYHTVWTPKKIADFVTDLAVKDGGNHVKTFDKQCDAVSYADKLNSETKDAQGFYCVMIEDIAKAIKKSVRLSGETVKQCQAISNHGKINWSGSINQIAQRYALYNEKNLPDLTDGEINAIAQAYNGHIYGDDIMLEVKSMDWNISEAIQCDTNVVENLGDTDPAEFIKRAKDWTISERMAVIAKVQAFWNDSRPHYDDA